MRYPPDRDSFDTTGPEAILFCAALGQVIFCCGFHHPPTSTNTGCQSLPNLFLSPLHCIVTLTSSTGRPSLICFIRYLEHSSYTVILSTHNLTHHDTRLPHARPPTTFLLCATFRGQLQPCLVQLSGQFLKTFRYR